MKKLLLIWFILISTTAFSEEINLVCTRDDPNLLPTMKFTTYSFKKMNNGPLQIYQNEKSIVFNSENGVQKLVSSRISNDEIKFETEYTNEEESIGNGKFIIPKGWSKTTTTISRIDGSWLMVTYWRGGLNEGYDPKPSNPILKSGKCESRRQNKF